MEKSAPLWVLLNQLSKTHVWALIAFYCALTLQGGLVTPLLFAKEYTPNPASSHYSFRIWQQKIAGIQMFIQSPPSLELGGREPL